MSKKAGRFPDWERIRLSVRFTGLAYFALRLFS